MRIFTYYNGPDHKWFRLFGRGLYAKRKSNMSFSERYGYRKTICMFSWIIGVCPNWIDTNDEWSEAAIFPGLDEIITTGWDNLDGDPDEVDRLSKVIQNADSQQSDWGMYIKDQIYRMLTDDQNPTD